MSEQPQVGDTVRLTITTEGVVYMDQSGRIGVGSWYLDGPNHAVKILSRPIPPLPSEPGTWWLDKSDDVWRVQSGGRLLCIASLGADPSVYGPFRQLILK